MQSEDYRTCGADTVASALRWYLCAFVGLSLAGWLPEVAGRLGESWASCDFSALFHPACDFHDAAGFGDLTNFAERMVHLTAPGLLTGKGPFPYLPPAAFLFAFYLRCFGHPVVAYQVSFALCMGTLAVLLWRTLQIRFAWNSLAMWVIGITTVIGYPQVYAGNRGNLEWVNFALATLGVWAFARQRYRSCSLLLAASVCLKPFPILFFLLLAWKGRWKEIASGLTLIAVVCLAALYALGPSVPIAAHSIQAGWSNYFAQYTVVIRPIEETRFYHSLMDSWKLILWFVYEHQGFDPRALVEGVPWWVRLDWAARLNIVVSAAWLAWVAVRFSRLPMLNRVFALTISVIILPYGAADYTLLLLYLPMGMFVRMLLRDMATGRVHMSRGALLQILLPLSLLLTPMSYLSVLSGFGKTAVLLYLLVQVTLRPMPGSLFGELSADSSVGS